MNNKTILISIACLLVGFIVAYLALNPPSSYDQPETGVIPSHNQAPDNIPATSNPFSSFEKQPQDDARLSVLEEQISEIKQQIQEIQFAIQEIKTTQQPEPATRPASVDRRRSTSILSRRLFSYDNLLKGGIEPGIAEDIARRANAIDLKKLELQDRATRGGYLDTQRYYDELADINNQEISLRDELGDDLYDEYLYNSKQNNRIKITTVITGSAAELAGIKQNDIVLSYDNKRMFTWDELKAMTTEGQLGEYVAISIYRNGEIFSFSVPRGPLGVQLGTTRVPPD